MLTSSGRPACVCVSTWVRMYKQVYVWGGVVCVCIYVCCVMPHLYSPGILFPLAKSQLPRDYTREPQTTHLLACLAVTAILSHCWLRPMHEYANKRKKAFNVSLALLVRLR